MNNPFFYFGLTMSVLYVAGGISVLIWGGRFLNVPEWGLYVPAWGRIVLGSFMIVYGLFRLKRSYAVAKEVNEQQ